MCTFSDDDLFAADPHQHGNKILAPHTTTASLETYAAGELILLK
jgi:hypothetical protein